MKLIRIFLLFLVLVLIDLFFTGYVFTQYVAPKVQTLQSAETPHTTNATKHQKNSIDLNSTLHVSE